MIYPHCYLLIWECACQNTLSLVIWEAPDDEADAEEMEAA